MADWLIEEQTDATVDVRLDRRYVWWELDDEYEALDAIRRHPQGGKGTKVVFVSEDGYRTTLRP